MTCPRAPSYEFTGSAWKPICVLWSGRVREAVSRDRLLDQDKGVGPRFAERSSTTSCRLVSRRVRDARSLATLRPVETDDAR
ncbi:MAG: hypothetical protein V1809_10940 [Planctomycetota bacterium]